MNTVLNGTSLDRLYPNVLEALLTHGEDIAPRGMKTKELRGATIHLQGAEHNIIRCPVRKLNYGFGCAEAIWMLAGMNDVETVNAVNKNIAAFSDNGRTFYGSYGPMLADQLPYVIGTLQSDPSSRQAVISIWRPRPGLTKDVPCTVSMQFFIRKNAVQMHVHMRSNDVWLGLPYDIFNFTTIQHMVAAELGLAVGSYTHHVGSLHIYEKHYAVARESIEAAHSGTTAVSYWYPSFEKGDWCVPARVRAEFSAMIAVKTGNMPDLAVKIMRESTWENTMSRGYKLMLDAIASKLKIGEAQLPSIYHVRA